MKSKVVLLVLVALVSVFGIAAAKDSLVLATTTSTADSGLLDQLLPVFEAANDLEVKVIAVGTGQAISYGELGDCDLILVHNRPAEDKFVAEGFGIDREDVMYNDFVIVGPAADPAQVEGKNVVDALGDLANLGIKFVSRGDDSGTHKKEFELWEHVGLDPKGAWYLSIGKGMGDTLVMANELQAYTMTDRGTFASMRDKLELEVLVSGDDLLLNPYGVIAVNPELHPGVNYAGATALIQFFISEEAKDIIRNYQVNGEQLFYLYPED